MRGKIVKGIAGFYYVHIEDRGIYECKAKGSFRNQRRKPLVGDDVTIEILSAQEHTGRIAELLPRKNELLRPAVANADQVLIIFAAASPEPNLNLLDRFLVSMEHQRVPVMICINKIDLNRAQAERLLQIYADTAGYPVLFTSIAEQTGIEAVRRQLQGRTTVLAGPSGVGKSSMLNTLVPAANMDTGEVSVKIGRGRHTTRHSEIFYVEKDTYLLDTPGFSSLLLDGIEAEELRFAFPEFREYEGSCRYHGCAHINEPDCRVKDAVQKNKIAACRYENYKVFYEELKNKKRY